VLLLVDRWSADVVRGGTGDWRSSAELVRSSGLMRLMWRERDTLTFTCWVYACFTRGPRMQAILCS
jgi:hypothetical protein